jgi:hypothetical protein
MEIGHGAKVHLRERELPSGRLIVKCSRHLTAVIEGVIHDTMILRAKGCAAFTDTSSWHPSNSRINLCT